LDAIKETLKNPQDPLKAVVALQDDNAKLKKQIEQLLKEKAKGLKGELASKLQDINGIKFLATQVDLNPEGAKDLAYELGTLGTNLFLVIATSEDDKPMLSCYISKELVVEKNLNAGTVVRELGKYIQGGGGGQPFFATAGGKNVAGIKEALEKAVDFVKS
jgi:alanyl-tRNA synthetase